MFTRHSILNTTSCLLQGAPEYSCSKYKYKYKYKIYSSDGVAAAPGGSVAGLPVRGDFVAFVCVCTTLPALVWGQDYLQLSTTSLTGVADDS
jgi:hypothetical protein